MKKLLNPFLITGSFLIFIFFAASILSYSFSLNQANQIDLKNKFSPPSKSHFFGTDESGADVFPKILIGARISMTVAFSVVLLSLIIGLIYGSISGFFGGTLDNVMMRVLDLFYAFPGFLLALALVATLGPSIRNLIFALTLNGWTGFARLVRGEILHIKEREFVQAARAIGSGPIRIIVRYLWPNLFGVLLVQSTFSLAGTLIVESGLSFLGLGAPPEIPTWGTLLNTGRFYVVEASHLTVFPGLCIVLLVLGFNLFGDGLKQILDPKKNSVV